MLCIKFSIFYLEDQRTGSNWSQTSPISIIADFCMPFHPFLAFFICTSNFICKSKAWVGKAEKWGRKWVQEILCLGNRSVDMHIPLFCVLITVLRICGRLSSHFFVDNQVWAGCVSGVCSMFCKQLHSNEFARVIILHCSMKRSLIRSQYSKNLNWKKQHYSELASIQGRFLLFLVFWKLVYWASGSYCC